jgi:hypothetical protein
MYDVIVWNATNDIIRRERISALSTGDAKQEMLDRMSNREAKQYSVITARRSTSL